MKDRIERILVVLLVMTIMPTVFGNSPRFLLTISEVLAEGAQSVSIPEAFSLEPSSIGEMHNSDLWSYAIRDLDGWAILTEYCGDGSNITIPYEIDGINVVGLSSGVLDGYSGIVKMHGNILYIAEDAFGNGTPTVLLK